MLRAATIGTLDRRFDEKEVTEVIIGWTEGMMLWSSDTSCIVDRAALFGGCTGKHKWYFTSIVNKVAVLHNWVTQV